MSNKDPFRYESQLVAAILMFAALLGFFLIRALPRLMAWFEAWRSLR